MDGPVIITSSDVGYRAFNASLRRTKTIANRLTLEGSERDLRRAPSVGSLIWEQQVPCIIIGDGARVGGNFSSV